MRISKLSMILGALILLVALAPEALAQETAGTAPETTEAVETMDQTEAEEIEPDAEEEEKTPAASEGTCGESLAWRISGSTLVISGSGEMEDGCPWQQSAGKIKTVILDGEITYVGAGAFAEFEAITAVDFGGSLKEIGEGAFRGCTALEEISLPDTFRRFGPESFAGCASLERIHCAGGMPSFKGGCIRDCGYITIYYPANNPWPQEEIQRLMDNFSGRLEILMATGETPEPAKVVPEEPLETEPEETEPAQTKEETVPTTQAPPPVQTEPETFVPTTAAAEEPEVTEAIAQETLGEVYTLPTMVTEVREPEPEADGLGGGIIAVILIAGVLTFFIAGALIAKRAGREDGKYSR